MKTSVTSASLLLAAAGFPGTLFAEIIGVPLPAVLDVGTGLTFGLFVTALTLLTMFSDYARTTRPLAPTVSTAPLQPAPFPVVSRIRATESRRLAA